MDYEALSRTPLFQGMTEETVRSLIGRLGGTEKKYARDQLICRAGDAVPALGIVLEGGAFIENDDLWGNRSILDRLEPGEIFGEAYACMPGERLMVSVRAATAARVLFLEVGELLDGDGGREEFSLLLRNLLRISARKNLILSRRIFHTSAKSIRGRLYSYLSSQAVLNGNREFEIPFNRQQLADYLNVDRSALSAELGKMQREGLLEVRKNHFRLPEDGLAGE